MGTQKNTSEVLIFLLYIISLLAWKTLSQDKKPFSSKASAKLYILKFRFLINNLKLQYSYSLVVMEKHVGSVKFIIIDQYKGLTAHFPDYTRGLYIMISLWLAPQRYVPK